MRHLPLALLVALLVALLLVACGSDPSPAAVDAAQPDALGVDVAAVVDAAADTASDASETPDTAPDAAVDVAVADAAHDATAGDAPGDVSRDAVAVVDADPLGTRATAVSVVVRSSSVTWSTPRAQPTCTVTGSTLSLGADYDRPEGAGFTVLGPLAGPVTLTGIAGGTGMSDVRATVTSGARYLTDGETVQRVNVIVRGTPWPGVSVEVTALGCVVR